MNTVDLTSYIPGYEEYQERISRVPYEDYADLEEKIETYEKAIEEIEIILSNITDYKYDIQCVRAVIEDMKREL